MYANLKRRWKIGRQGVGEEWQAYNGILQGCGLSVVLLNCLTAVWIRALEEEADPKDKVQGGGYADDINGTAASQKGGQHVVDVTGDYAELTGQEISGNIWGAGREKLLLRSENEGPALGGGAAL